MTGKKKKHSNETLLKPVEKRELTGVMILALGVSAVLGVGIYASLKYFKSSESRMIVSAAQDGIELAIMRDKQVLAQKLPQNANKMAHPALAEITGSWKTVFGANGIAVLFLSETAFQLTVTTDPTGASREYSKGTVIYEQATGKLSLIPSPESGAPDAVKGVEYRVLTMRAFDVYLSQQANDPSLYFVAPQEEVAGRTFHPLFLRADYLGAPVLKFQKIE